MTAFTKKEALFSWGLDQEEAFTALKSAFCSDSVLAYLDFQKPFILTTDALGTVLGAVLSHIHDGTERPIAYASHQMNAALKITLLRRGNYWQLCGQFGISGAIY